MSNYILANDKCEKFFNNPRAFVCATESHQGIKNDVFIKYHQYWQLIKDKHGLKN